MPRALLNIPEIKELNIQVRKVFAYIQNLKKEELIAQYINNPKIPAILTESLAIHLIKAGKIIPELKDANLKFGGKIADVLAAHDKKVLKIEVKSTGKSAFQNFGEKDIAADYLIWIHFNTFFEGDKNIPIEIYTIENPAQYFDKSMKITLVKLHQMVNSGIVKTVIKIEEL